MYLNINKFLTKFIDQPEDLKKYCSQNKYFYQLCTDNKDSIAKYFLKKYKVNYKNPDDFIYVGVKMEDYIVNGKWLYQSIFKLYMKNFKQSGSGRNKEKTKEYREKNKDKIKEYREKNKEKRKEYIKEYNKKIKDKISQNNKEYREKNKDTLLQKQKEYYEKNKDKAKEYYEKNKIAKILLDFANQK
jgi:hypothetical protein